MIRKYHNHQPQTTPWHREEEQLNHHETPGRQIKQNNQLSLPHPVQSQRRYYRLQQIELQFVLQMEWCINHHIRAQYVEATLQCTEKNIQSAQMQSRTSTRGSFWLHQSFLFYFEDNELYLLSFGVSAKPDIAKDLIEAYDVGRRAVADFIDSLLVGNLTFTTP